MTSARTRTLAAGRIVLLDDAGDLAADHAGRIVVCGDPATLRTARALLRFPPSLAILHDAGVGKDAAGTAGLDRLADVHVPAVAVAHDSARLGDAEDVLEQGRIAHLNAPARALGLEEGPLLRQLDRPTSAYVRNLSPA